MVILRGLLTESYVAEALQMEFILLILPPLKEEELSTAPPPPTRSLFTASSPSDTLLWSSEWVASSAELSPVGTVTETEAFVQAMNVAKTVSVATDKRRKLI